MSLFGNTGSKLSGSLLGTGQQQQSATTPIFITTPSLTTQPASIFGNPIAQQDKSIFSKATAAPSVFGQQTSSQQQTNASSGLTSAGTGLKQPVSTGSSILGTKRFLPGRPSLQDILAVAPQWKSAFDQINKDLLERDTHISSLKSLLRDLRTKNEAQRALLTEKVEVAKSHRASQSWIESETESLHPTIVKLQRQCAALSASCERTMSATERTGSGASSATSQQPLIVPQPEYLRFINDLIQRSQALQEGADGVTRSITLLSDELTGASVSLTSDIKTMLRLVSKLFCIE